MQLRPYQTDAVKRIGGSLRKHGRTLFRLPTGGGKTAIFGYIAARYQEAGKRVIISVPRRLLVEQVIDRLAADWGVNVGVICAGYPSRFNRLVQVASMQTLSARLKDLHGFLQGCSLHVIDEAHHATAASTMRVIGAMPCKLLGVTATPQRLDDKPLDPPFNDLVIGVSESQLIEDGFLADYRLFLPSGMHDPNYGNMRDTEITAAERSKAERDVYRFGDAVRVYKKWLAGKRAIFFGYSVQDAENIAAKFNDAGIPAESVHGKMKREDVARAVRNYANGVTLVLTSCDLINEGFDVPATQGIGMMAKTQSLTRFMQNAGRGLRPKEDGSMAIIIDMVGNALTHGLPDDTRQWSLYPRERDRKRKKEAQVKNCPQCYAGNGVAATRCRVCGFLFEEAKKEDETKATDETADLSELDRKRFFTLQALPAGLRRKEVKKAKSLEELRLLGRAFGYKPSWAALCWEYKQKISNSYRMGRRG